MKKQVLLIALIAAVLIVVAVRNFVLSTTMSQPTAMKLYLPKETDSALETSKAQPIVSLLLYDGNKLYAYRGKDYANGRTFNTTDSAFSKYLLQIKNEVGDSSFVVAIKPDSTASYKNTVNALDVMTINDVKRYAMIDIFDQERKIIDSLRK